MKTKFVCEKCNKCFETENECIEHEKICCLKESFPIKGIFIGTDNNENFEIYIMEYPTATLFEKNKIKLVGESRHFIPFEISKLNLEEIYELFILKIYIIFKIGNNLTTIFFSFNFYFINFIFRIF